MQWSNANGQKFPLFLSLSPSLSLSLSLSVFPPLSTRYVRLANIEKFCSLMSLRKIFFTLTVALWTILVMNTGRAKFFSFRISPSYIGMVNVCLRRQGCDRIVFMDVITVVFFYCCLLFRFFSFSRVLIGKNLFVNDRKYGYFSFVIRINENFVLIFIRIPINIFLHNSSASWYICTSRLVLTYWHSWHPTSLKPSANLYWWQWSLQLFASAPVYFTAA